MKIPASVRKLYEDQVGPNAELRKRIDERLRNLKDSRWHYESRLKDLEGFALKVETGRVADPRSMEDFFACTLVVRNSVDVSAAEKLVCSEFGLCDRRPKDDGVAWKHADSFPFDDLRLYVRWKDDPNLPPTGIDGTVFECQIKTFLQHAWTIATHDLVYKTDAPHWGKQRIAFQIKAMLEHAEVSIQEAEKLASGVALSKTDRRGKVLAETIAVIREVWTAEDLPRDVRRLAENVSWVCDALRISVADLKATLEAERALGRGALTRNLSPFCVVLASLLRQRTAAFVAAVTDPNPRFKQTIVIPAEVELPAGTDTSGWVNALLLPP